MQKIIGLVFSAVIFFGEGNFRQLGKVNFLLFHFKEKVGNISHTIRIYIKCGADVIIFQHNNVTDRKAVPSEIFGTVDVEFGIDIVKNNSPALTSAYVRNISAVNFLIVVFIKWQIKLFQLIPAVE